jgi:predicted kinase
MRAILFDIDGTLADCEHRRVHLPNWGKFFGEMHLDPVIEPVAFLARQIQLSREAAVIIVTARPEDYRLVTQTWLRENFIAYDAIYFRPKGDYREDSIVKAEILQQIIDDGYEPFLVVDDRPQVVKMWREYGLMCLQCAPEEISLKHDGQHFLDILVGPAGAGKSEYAAKHYPKHEIISTDSIRTELFGSYTNPAAHTPEGLEKTWRYAHGLLRTHLECHLRTCFDATNLKIKDRAKLLRQVPAGQYVRYIVIDRDYDAKMKTRDWRPEELVHKHHRTFHAELKNILAGDNQPNVVVVDER